MSRRGVHWRALKNRTEQGADPLPIDMPADAVLRFGDLLVVSALAVAAAIVACTDLSQYRWLSAFGLLLALVLPGYALSASALPELHGIERLLCTLGLSLVVDVLGGLVLYATALELSPVSWSLWLGGITLLGSLYAGFQRSMVPIQPPQYWPRLPWKSLFCFELATAVLLLAVGVAVLGAMQRGNGSTQLWAVPATSAGVSTIQIGVSNQEAETVSYVVEVESSGTLLQEWRGIELKPDATWTVSLVLQNAPDLPIQVHLFRLGEPNESYRSVLISPAAWQVTSDLSAQSR